MGQYYKAIILASQQEDAKEIIRTWIDPDYYSNGYKLMEHSYIRNQFVQAVEYLISPLGMFYKSRLVWAGDYADPEQGLNENLYKIASHVSNEGKHSSPPTYSMDAYKYIVNHTKKQYVVKYYESLSVIHPLPLLTAEGNGSGGGDYRGNNEELVGTWARNVISMEEEIPAGYQELVCNWSE